MTAASNVVVLKYKPRPAFEPFHARSKRFAVLVCHRRAGKTEAALYDLLIKALKKKWDDRPGAPPRYAYFAPYRSQAKDVLWERLKIAVAQIPGCKLSESDLSVKLPNGALIKLYGADDPDSIRGNYLDGVVLDEFGDMKAEMYSKVLRVMLSDYKGWVVFLGTPKGKNAFWDKWQQANRDPDRWFSMMLKASESGIISKSEIDEIILDLEPDEVEQELECSFEAAIKGSYFGQHMIALSKAGKLKPTVEYVPTEKVHLAMDIGRSDACSIWFWQVVNGEIRFFDYFEETGWDAIEMSEMLALKPYNYGTWWLPHDAMHKTFASKKSVIDTFREYNAPAKKVPNPDNGSGRAHGIDAVRKFLRTYPVVFDATRCERGIECLRNYSRKWDMDNKVFSNAPSHDQWSHGADAFRYAVLSIKPNDIALSVERHNTKAQLSNPQINIAIHAGVTLQEAFDEHDRKLRNQSYAERRC